MCKTGAYHMGLQASGSHDTVMGNDPTDKSAENLIIVDADGDVNIDAVVDIKKRGRKNQRFISQLIMEWNLDKKLFSMVVDNASSNDSMARHLKSWLSDRVPRGGDFFHVLMDVQHMWDSTYDMLDVALNYEEEFKSLEGMDKNYKFNSSKKEWKVARLVHDYICDIKIQLMELETSPEEFLQLMADPMSIKFSKYWDECSWCLAIAVVLDPGYKMDIIEYYYNRLYESVIGDIGAGHLMYSSCVTHSITIRGNKLSDFKKWKERERLIGSRHVPKSEFDQYLEEETHLMADKFNILTWCAVNGSRFPTISKITRDVLVIPATTVTSESSFSIGGRVIDESRSCLLLDVVEALITTSDRILSTRNLTLKMYSNEREETSAKIPSVM
ncbi:zinc finger BED domain-containing protein RICESLEEPER 2-like [Apium graveolens]|uniref:zinc finger BED domain-containing protein RICESLEEPER 2-like n=1 Tax=Apium graveolens TaxID=4045 RepID=UPI003D7AE0E3